MKTADITRALRNSATPAARLASWQSLPIAKRLAAIKERLAPGNCTYACNVPMPANPRDATIADWRRALIHDPAFYLAPVPHVWESENGREAHLSLHGLNDSRILREWDCKELPARRWLDHTGWYTDEFSGDTIRPAVVELTRFPGILFAATIDSCAGMVSVDLTTWEAVDFSDCESDYDADSAREETAQNVMRSANSIAENLAEDEREYQRKWRIENDIEENRETLKSLRQSIRALAGELKSLCPSPMAGSYPAAAAALRQSLARMLGERSRIMEENRELAESI